MRQCHEIFLESRRGWKKGDPSTKTRDFLPQFTPQIHPQDRPGRDHICTVFKDLFGNFKPSHLPVFPPKKKAPQPPTLSAAWDWKIKEWETTEPLFSPISFTTASHNCNTESVGRKPAVFSVPNRRLWVVGLGPNKKQAKLCIIGSLWALLTSLEYSYVKSWIILVPIP